MSKFVLIASALFVLGMSFPTLAQETVRDACAQDLQQYCPNAQSRDDRRQCMQQNRISFRTAARRH
jgi:hypothetical protein